MINFEQLLAEVAKTLEDRDARWALIGGLAVGARSEPRFTRDVDVAVAVSDDTEAESLVRELVATGYQLEALLEHDSGRLATVRLIPPAVKIPVLVDLLFCSSGIEPEVVSGAEPTEVFPGVVVPVATCAHLVAMKLLARDDRQRPQDRLDLKTLLAYLESEGEVYEALDLIQARGFHRGRDLAREFKDTLKELGTSG